MAKGDIAHQFHLLQQRLQTSSAAEASEHSCIWDRVKAQMCRLLDRQTNDRKVIPTNTGDTQTCT